MSGRARINGERLLKRLDDFASIGATAAGGVNRQALTPCDRDARALLARLAMERGFGVFQDPLANLFIRREGRDGHAPPFLIGSHLDSQPTGGRFDGALGTLAAFEVLEALEDAGAETDAPIEVVAWTNEEGCRFAPGAMGSMAFSLGRMPDGWQEIKGTDGVLLSDALNATLEALPAARSRPLGFPVLGYLELHIEQGPSLEKENLAIGVVTGIQGTRWLEITVTGQAAHAGTTEFAFRRDPMVAVSRALNALYDTIMPDDPNARFTVGRLMVHPGSVNSIPGSVFLSIDIRHPDSARLDEIEARVRTLFTDAAPSTGCTLDIRKTFDMSPATFSSICIDGVATAAQQLRLPFKQMVSGAFHDALYVSRVAPAAMIFVSCRDGLSHNEAEHVEPEHAVAGARVLLESTRVNLANLTARL
ncbi:Zn-dependent hydrolase [Rhizobium herbae]|uniref:N-carbamoyl-L-amino-acid hydrolase n=1 Tax=Rhizobium herbae TaxID=508661 RepID=A0ABS4EIV6_9HYPH|nr:Zn-dependent hydrolase [Rhizobium herbae]MBP1857881.1 N-carbamoyl-L-amino-acid hydrolase [Rhizobium herbae]